MYCRWLLTFVLSIIFAVQTHAETFTVTSNADSGPGTLREALTKAAANGDAEKDFIYFNLPDVSEAGRTIVVLTAMPQLTSNLIIDGSTQPGNKLGISNAKIIIKTFRSSTELKVFSGNNINQIEFYSLFLLDTTNPCLSDPAGAPKTAIDIKNSQNIILGSIGKGNVINGYKYESISFRSDKRITIADNIFGLNPLSAELDPVCSSSILLENAENVNVGYENAGNTFFTGITISVPKTDGVNVINVKHNNFGVGPDGVSTWHAGSGTYLSIYYAAPTPTEAQPPVNITISENLISHYGESAGGMVFSRLGGILTIKHNWFGTDRSSTLPLNLRQAHPGIGTALWLEALTAEAIIGDEDPALANKFFYSYYGIMADNVKKLKLIRNSFKCIGEKDYYNSAILPKIAVAENTNSYISGTTAPNALVDIFASDDCVNCSPQTYIGSTTADAAGNWKYNYLSAPTGSIIANAHVGEVSSYFSKPEINVSKLEVTGFDCGHSGKVTGITVANSNTFKWVDANNNIVSTELELKNAAPGRYKLILGKFCTVESDYITIEDLRPQIYDGFMSITNPSCGQQNGTITNLIAYTMDGKPLIYSWYDANNKLVGTTQNIENLPPGQYTFSAKTASGCESIYGPVVLKAVGAAVINQNEQLVTQTACNQATGSITGITATGTGALTYSWRNSLDVEVGNTADLTNQPAGVYKLKVTDESACGPVYSEPIEITAINGVKLVTSNVSVRSSTCGLANGYIRGLQAPGATTFIWTRDDGSVAGNTLDLENIPAGNYRLTINNATCANYADFRIDAVTPTVYPQFAATITKTCAAFPTGTITINTDGAQDQPGVFRWVDSQNNTAGFGKTIQYLPAGAYKLYLTDAGSCESFYKEYVVDSYPELKVTFGNAHDIYCGVGKGSIDPAAASGGMGNYYYEWKDGSGTVIPGKTQPFINDLDAGTYTLSITDGGCNLAMLTYTIKEQTQIIPAPIIADVEVTRTGNTTLKVTDPFPTAIYRLYDSESSLTPLAESQGGSFTVNVTGNRSYYIGLSYGECESPRTRVKVVLTILNVNIPNTFTPNGDGFNDYWTITGIEESKIATVKIFSRSGQMVFQSIGYPKPFDGTQNGKQLPSSTYYYIIEQKNVKPISGYVTILR